MSDEDRARAAAAEIAAGWVEAETTIGLGSGRAVRAVIAALGRRWPGGAPVRAVVASRSSDAAAREAGIEVLSLNAALALAMVIDGADEIDPALQLLKGGGGALLHEKILADAGGGLVVVAEADKHVERLGLRHPLPIEVVRFGWETTARRVQEVASPPQPAGAARRRDRRAVRHRGGTPPARRAARPRGGPAHARPAPVGDPRRRRARAVPGHRPRCRARCRGRIDGGASPMSVVGILHPGAMGSAIGAELRAAGHEVLWASEGRGAETARRAEDAGLRDAGTPPELARQADVVISVCPPHAARDVAALVAGHASVFVDANAVSPATAREIADTVAGAGAHAVDGGIVGPPPRGDASASLLLSGADAATIAELFDGTRVRARVIGVEIGAASAAKMAYAGWTKGSMALLLAVRALAVAEGVEDALLAEWAISHPDLPAASERAARGAAGKSWRWVGEMEEIATTLRDAGLPGGFHEAAGAVYERLAAEQETDLRAVLDALVCGTLRDG
jgi:ribose 5-phosphate isomerase